MTYVGAVGELILPRTSCFCWLLLIASLPVSIQLSNPRVTFSYLLSCFVSHREGRSRVRPVMKATPLTESA